jgi:hypothetical protein
MTALIDHRQDIKYSANPHYICGGCAVAYGGTWPKGHQATVHQSVCFYCGETKPLASTGDWNWPEGLPRDMKLGMRD